MYYLFISHFQEEESLVILEIIVRTIYSDQCYGNAVYASITFTNLMTFAAVNNQ